MTFKLLIQFFFSTFRNENIFSGIFLGIFCQQWNGDHLFYLDSVRPNPKSRFQSKSMKLERILFPYFFDRNVKLQYRSIPNFRQINICVSTLLTEKTVANRLVFFNYSNYLGSAGDVDSRDFSHCTSLVCSIVYLNC